MEAMHIRQISNFIRHKEVKLYLISRLNQIRRSRFQGLYNRIQRV